ncbi:LysR substrate-binding domain-containing protein [Kiloniella majae]|uniref:LysR substrate-binding domain-containing protein n=1 Tax=Kiloniella majae TaxID=1938558 RepID=UPI000A2770B5|nr:LysR substrate-binding domain-containing protein [Kiloniella majae]
MNDRNPQPPLLAMRVFEAVARLGSVSLAASSLGVTQPAVSQQLRKLELYVGGSLTERVSTGITLTPRGTRLAERLSAGFRLLQEGMEEASGKGQVTLAVLSSFAQRWLIPRMSGLQQQNPEIDLRLVTRATLPDLRRVEADLAIIPERMMGAGVEKIAIKNEKIFLMPDDAWLVLSPELQMKNPVRAAADISKHTLIRIEESPRDQDWQFWMHKSGVEGVEPVSWQSFMNSSHALEAAVAGVGIAIGHRAMIIDAVSSGRLVLPLSMSIGSDMAYYLSTSRNTFGNAQYGIVKDWLLAQAHEDKKKDGVFTPPF